MLVVVKGKMVI